MAGVVAEQLFLRRDGVDVTPHGWDCVLPEDVVALNRLCIAVVQPLVGVRHIQVVAPSNETDDCYTIICVGNRSCVVTLDYMLGLAYDEKGVRNPRVLDLYIDPTLPVADLAPHWTAKEGETQTMWPALVLTMLSARAMQRRSTIPLDPSSSLLTTQTRGGGAAGAPRCYIEPGMRTRSGAALPAGVDFELLSPTLFPKPRNGGGLAVPLPPDVSDQRIRDYLTTTFNYLYNLHASLTQAPPLRDRPLQLVLDLQPSRNVYRCLAIAYRRPLTIDDFLRLYLIFNFNGVQQVGFHFGQEVAGGSSVPPGAIFVDIQFDPTNLAALPSNVTSPIQLNLKRGSDIDVSSAASKRPVPSPPATPPVVISS